MGSKLVPVLVGGGLGLLVGELLVSQLHPPPQRRVPPPGTDETTKNTMLTEDLLNEQRTSETSSLYVGAAGLIGAVLATRMSK